MQTDTQVVITQATSETGEYPEVSISGATGRYQAQTEKDGKDTQDLLNAEDSMTMVPTCQNAESSKRNGVVITLTKSAHGDCTYHTRADLYQQSDTTTKMNRKCSVKTLLLST